MLRIFFYNISWNITVSRGSGYVSGFNFFTTSSGFIVSKLKKSCFYEEIFYCYDNWMILVFFQYKSYWIISIYWINSSQKINVLIRRNFAVINNISHSVISLFMILSFSAHVIFGELTVFSEKKKFDVFQKVLLPMQLHVFRQDYRNILFSPS